MKTTMSLLRTIALVLATVGSILPARAGYDYTVSNAGEALGGFTVALDGTQTTDVYAGGIHLAAQGASVAGYADFTTVCLDFNGTLKMNQTYSFNESAFTGQTGLDPQWGNPLSATANATASYQALNNAAFLFATHSNPSSATDWAALQLAIWKVLYDTDSTGQIVWGSSARFSVTTDPTSAAWTEAQTWINNLPRTTDYAGYLLAPLNSSGQELLLGVTPVPEPATFLAGAALLLPFGISTLRLLRRRAKA